MNHKHQTVPVAFDEIITRDGAGSKSAGEMRPLNAPPFSELALSLEFSVRHRDDLRYTATLGHWHQFDGHRWERDDTLHVFDLAREICQQASENSGDKEGLARKLTSAQTVAAVERLARCDRRHAARVEMWDANPWLLNTPSGTVDLKTGELHGHHRSDYLTKVTAIGPEPGRPEQWDKFLLRAMDGNGEDISFLQRWFGYSLTGVTREHAMAFFYGTGRNGKTVTINTITGILGDYAWTAPTEMFMVQKVNQHPTDLASLMGARLVTAIETEEGRRWAESKIKALTGGDRIPARFMRQDFFEYTPQFKLLIASNHKPGLRSVDEAIRSRMNLIPFSVVIPKAERDLELSDKLKGEWPRILQWCIEGCLAWQREGLNPPARVIEATNEYLDSEDSIGRWLEEKCLTGKQYNTSSSVLFAGWKSWAQCNNEPEGSQRRFSQALKDRGFTSEHSRRGAVFNGVILRADVPADVPAGDET